MVPQTENFENISVNIYETGSFTKFDERDSDTNFFDDITKSNNDTSYFKPNEVKPYLRSTQYFNIRSTKRNFGNLKVLLEECELVFNLCFSETWCSNTELQNKSNLSLTGFESVL